MRHALATLSVLILSAASALANGYGGVSQSIGFAPVGGYDSCGVGQAVVQQSFVPVQQSYVVQQQIPVIQQQVPVYRQAVGFSNVGVGCGVGGLQQRAFLPAGGYVGRGVGFAPVGGGIGFAPVGGGGRGRFVIRQRQVVRGRSR
jgi:hypothetical protein